MFIKLQKEQNHTYLMDQLLVDAIENFKKNDYLTEIMHITNLCRDL